MGFSETYGPWALVAGASEGIGRAFANKIAADGVNLVLAARREQPLADLARELGEAHGVECRTVATDLSAPHALDDVLAAATGIEIGLFVYNVGADTVGQRFLDAPVESWLQLSDLNIATSVRFAHHFGIEMKARRRGGIVLVGSGACYGGSGFTSIYSGAKAFEMCFAEGLWSELKPHDVQVLYCALGPTDTPAFRDLLGRKGVDVPQGLAAPDEVAAAVLGHIAEGPVFNWGQADDAPGLLSTSAADRRKRVLMVDQGSKRIYGE